MAGVDVQAKIKKGLAKANEKLGKGDLTHLLKETKSGGGTPLDPPVITTEQILLVDVVFKSISQDLINGTSILQGDRVMVANGDVVLTQNDVIQQGSSKMTIQDIDVKNPAGVLLAQICIVREI